MRQLYLVYCLPTNLKSMHKSEKFVHQFFISSVIFLYCLIVADSSQAQVTDDGSLPTNVNTSDNLNFNITGGKQVGDKLFHSFSQFSVPTGGSANFNNTQNIQNIFSRVTGDSISNIDGLIQTENSNLFLLNPNGIIFGSNAELNIGGSFIATTAERIDFTDDNSFSATNVQSSPLLTLSIPIGLQFDKTPERIVNRSAVEDSSGIPIGLQVPLGRTLALVGGDIFLEGGDLSASGGRIELKSVADNSSVSLTPIAEGWILGNENVQNFKNIHLTQRASINTNGESGGNILLQGKKITIAESSALVTFNFGVDSSEAIVVKASESIELSDSSINTNTLSTGSSGDIEIETKRLIVGNDSFIDTSNQGNGQGGNLTVNASESVDIDGNEGLSRLTTATIFGESDAGDLKVTTQRLILRNGGQLFSSTSSIGNGGEIIINALESIEIIGQGTLEIEESGVFSETIGIEATGNAGDIVIDTERLVLRDGGAISVAAVEGSTGRAGNIEIDANSLFLNRGTITAETAQTGGEAGANINLEIADLLKLGNESLISATASDEADGGNIDINANFVVAIPNQNSDIIARAEQGTGGNIDITTDGIFGISQRSSTPGNNTNDIDPSSDFGLDGTVDINEIEVNPAEGLEELPTEVIDVARLVAQNLCQQGRGSEFIVTGKGGIAPSPTQARDGEISEIDLVEPASSEDDALRGRGVQAFEETSKDSPSVSQNVRTQSEGRSDRLFAHPEAESEIIEAQGWIINDRGILELVAHRTDLGNFSPQLSAKQLCP